MSENSLIAKVEDGCLKIDLTLDGAHKGVDLRLDEDGRIEGESVVAAIEVLARDSGLEWPESAYSLAMKEVLARSAGISPAEGR